jgi:hypothetical protein
LLYYVYCAYYAAGADFDSTGGVFRFNASSARTYTFDVPLVRDDVYESIEDFRAQLSFVEIADHERVTIDPNSAHVLIEDGNYYYTQKLKIVIYGKYIFGAVLI